MFVRSRRVALLALAIGLLIVIGGCAAEPAATPEQPVAGGGDVGSAPDEIGTGLGDLSVRLEPFVSGFENPVYVTHAGDGSGRLFVVEQTGRVRTVRDGKTAREPYLDISQRISTGGERGLLGLAFAPDFEATGRFYVDYTDTEGNTVVARFTASDPASDIPVLEGPEAVLRVKQPYSNHNGGCIVFAPNGTLWVGMGDGGAAGDPQDNAQDDRALLGKMLSLDVEGTDVPEPRIVQTGLRNPWRFSFDRETDALWIGDVGQNAHEEVNAVEFEVAEGLNFGWARWEANDAYPPGAKRSRDGFTFPVIDYGRDIGQSVTGGYVYRGTAYPSLQGTYVFGDYVSGWIGGAQRDADGVVRWQRIVDDTGILPSSFGEDEDGELYVCDHNGSVLRVIGE